MSKDSFTVKVGSFQVKGYRLADGRYCLTYYLQGRRRRETRANEADAKARAVEVARDADAQRGAKIELTAADSETHKAALAILKPHGVGLRDAAEQFAAAVAKLRGVPLAEAVNYFVANHADVPPRTVAEVAGEMLAAKRRDNLARAYLRDLETRLPQIAKAFNGAKVADVTRPQIETWLRSLPVSPRTRNNLLRVTVTLWRFARSCGYLPQDRTTAAEGLRPVKDVGGAIGIFRPGELAELLKKADADLVPFLAIGAFCGLRHAELLRLDWADVRLDQGFVEVTAQKSKTAQRRLVPIVPSLAAWLSPFAGQIGRVCKEVRIQRRAAELAKSLGVPWPNNGLRHSFASYRLAQTQNAAQVALECGNSPQMIFRHYRELTTPKDAATWFDIQPECPANVTPMMAAAGG